jgi:hypothetical protein
VRGTSVVRNTLSCADSVTFAMLSRRHLKERQSNATWRQSAYDVTPRLQVILTARIKCHAANGAIVVELAWVKSPFDGNKADLVDPTNEGGD